MNKPALIKMIGISKAFPGVVANDDVDFDLRAGEIHSIVGENGAGKTTLMNILAGMHQPDKGSIIVGDRKVRIRSPQDSLKLGIGMVYQHFTLVPNLTVLENLMLGFEGGLFLNLKKAEQKFQHISQAFGLEIDPYRTIRDLSVGERQRTEILKILYHESDALILDEPASMLSPAEAESLFHTLRLLRSAGKSVILITHDLKEALTVSDRITVMKSGRKAAELSGNTLRDLDTQAASARILDLMFGALPQPVNSGVESALDDSPLLELKNVVVYNNIGQIGLKHISFSIRKGEIIGIIGVAGEDQRLLAEVVGGQKHSHSGNLLYRSRDITQLGITQRFELGIRYIPADRINEGCILDMTLSENSIMQTYYRPPYSRFGILNQAYIGSFTSDLISRFGIRAIGSEAPVRTLSGGNIQKLMLARGFSGQPGLIICNHPTYGLDVKTVHFIQEKLKAQRRFGTAVLLITSDMDELFNCSNRIGVLFKGEMIGFMDRCEATEEKIGKLMLGVRE